MKHIPVSLRDDSGWRAAMYILQKAFPHCSDVWRYVDTDKHSIFFRKMLDGRAWSTSEGYMLDAAASLFDPDFQVKLHRLVNYLDDRQMNIVIGAMRAARVRFPESGCL